MTLLRKPVVELACGLALAAVLSEATAMRVRAADAYLARYLGLVLIGIGSLATAVVVCEYRKVMKYLRARLFKALQVSQECAVSIPLSLWPSSCAWLVCWHFSRSFLEQNFLGRQALVNPMIAARQPRPGGVTWGISE
jgi:hypothetical protein